MTLGLRHQIHLILPRLAGHTSTSGYILFFLSKGSLHTISEIRNPHAGNGPFDFSSPVVGHHLVETICARLVAMDFILHCHNNPHTARDSTWDFPTTVSTHTGQNVVQDDR